ncbi:unnamed protein product [Caenorhabditis sp. 36 PRJEB53466]|nr:unnamed protein product [Caenorhabditis sp. 36 PRJEB53466]
MHKIIVFFSLCVSILSSDPLGRCVINKFGNDQCQSSVCFSHFHTTSEGDVERFDCADEPTKLTNSSCLELLHRTQQESVCLEDDKETHCCCLSSLPARICAQDHRKTAELSGLWTFGQMLYFIFGHFGLCVVVCLLAVFYKYTVRIWPVDNVNVAEDSRLMMVFLGKTAFLLLSFITIYFPFRKTCMNHPKGVFVNPQLFLYQIFDAGMAPSLYFSFPLVFFVFDFSFYIHIRITRVINRSGGLAISVFKLLTVPLFVYETFLSTFALWSKDRQPGYCRFNGAIWQLMCSHILIVVYYILLIFQTILLCQLERDFDESQQSSEETPSHVATLLSTQSTETRIESYSSEMIYIYPRPFHVPRLGLSVLNVKSNQKSEWLALRALLSTTGFYKVYPSKFLIPPGKEISIEVEQCTRADSPTVHHNLLIEWFSIGPNPPSVDSQRLWNKPYLVPQTQWHYFVLPIYVDESTNSQLTSELE